jgi:DNA-directed RNA polymerase specialized sigma subunit
VTAKEFLQQIRKLDKLIENKIAESLQWREIANNTTVNMSGEKVQSSGNHDTVANAICTYLDLEVEIQKRIDELVAARQDVISVIEQLNVAEYDLLHKFYVQDFTLQEIASMYDMSYNWATTTHGRALKQVQTILNKREEAGKTFMGRGKDA